MSEPRTSYRLASAVERHRENPEGFSIPDRSAREGLRTGWLAKLVFEPGPDADEDESPERMFVEVIEASGVGYVGRLVNEPISLSSVAFGDQVSFGPEHVIDIVRLGRLKRFLLRRQLEGRG